MVIKSLNYVILLSIYIVLSSNDACSGANVEGLFLYNLLKLDRLGFSNNYNSRPRTTGNNAIQCTYKHQYYSWTKITRIPDPLKKEPEERKDWQNVDLVFTLYCYNQVATVLYEKHVLDKFKVKSCNPKDFESEILLPETKDETATLDERELPTSMSIYYIKNEGRCYAKKYTFKNYEDGQKEAGQIESTSPIKSLCSREAGLYIRGSDITSGKHYDLAVFGNCKTWNGLFYNVNNVKWTAKEWFPSALSLDPPGIKIDENTPHKKLLQCTYQTGDYLFKLLCIKLDGKPNYLAYVGEYKRTVDIERFNVLSCQEEHIVNSIFPPNYSTKQPDKGPVHTFTYAYYTGKCLKRSYNCAGTGQVLGTLARGTTCPRLEDFSSSSETLGRWENCDGPLKNPPVIDLTVD